MPQLRDTPAAPPLQPLVERADWCWMAAVAALYLVYLPFSGYSQQYFDAQNYWDLPSRFITPERHFSLLHYSSLTRGYVWPLLLTPWRTAWKLLGGDPMWYIRALGSVVAALLYGWLGPRLWQVLTGAGQSPRTGARLAFVLTGFVFWRDHFNFALTDFPALTLLSAATLLVVRGLPDGQRLTRTTLAGWWLAGTLLGMAVNIRGIYLLALYPLLLAGGWPAARTVAAIRASSLRVLALLLGGTLVLAPQYLMTQRHAPAGSSWHVSGVVNQQELVRRHLGQGISHFRYDASIDPAYSEARVWFDDPVGQALVRRHGISQAGIGLGGYLRLIGQYPIEFGALLTQRLFSGLDLQQPTPYLRQLYASTWLLAAANYTVLGLGLLVLGSRGWQARRLPWRRLLLVVALLVPALGALPMAVESRFLLPLHAALCAAATLGFPAAWYPARLRHSLRPTQQVLLMGLYVGWLVLSFTLSTYTQIQLEHGGRLVGGSGPAPVPERRP